MMTHDNDRRRPLLVRTDVELVAKLFPEAGNEVDVCLRNLSPAGFMAECEVPVQPGSHVNVSIPGVGSLPAQVRWNVRNRFGAIFHFELSTRELGLIRACSRSEPPIDSADAA